MRVPFLLAAATLGLLAASPEAIPLPDGLRPAGAALDGAVLAVWGAGGAALYDLDARRWSPVMPGCYGEGGAFADVDADGAADLVLAGPRGLTWRQAPGWREQVIDPGVVSRDVVFAAQEGRRGVLVLHRGGQLRFYGAPARGVSWTARDIYSFYSAVDQGGLLTVDVDRDGREDLLCGNYWLRPSARFEGSWRLFAIKLWSEDPLAALTAWAALPSGDLAAAQRARSPARLAWYRRPADPRHLWEERVVDSGLDQPATLAAVPGAGLLVAEQGPRGRVLLYPAGFSRRPRLLAQDYPVVRGFLLRGRLLAVGEQVIRWIAIR